MLIQEEVTRPAQPLATFDEDYERAVLHLAWAHHSQKDERTLLFAMVELLPIEVPPPLNDGEERVLPGGEGEPALLLRRIVVSARQGLEWHLNCRRGVAVLPDRTDALPNPGDHWATRLILADLGEEPPWPTLVCVSGESNTTPFCPAWHDSPRTHHLVPLASFALNKLWPGDVEQRNVTRWLADRLHFSLEAFPENWGSIHLVAPNPVYRSLRTRLYPKTPPRESVLARFEPRAGKSVEGLELTFTDKEPWGPLDVRRVVVKSPLLCLNFEREVQGVKEDVFDPKRGVLAASNREAYFMKSIQIGVEPITARVRVEGKAPGATYEVSRTAKSERPFSAGDNTRAPSARVRMSRAHFDRQNKGSGSKLDQLCFYNQREEATATLRSRINGARREVMIVDPQFGPDELVVFALAVSREDVRVRILSSPEVLQSQRTDGARTASLGELLRLALDKIALRAHMSPIDVRVMIEGPSRIDEHFLLVDDRIWLLGSPMNSFGEHPTVMVALPDPEPIRTMLLSAWNHASEFRHWMDQEGKNNAHRAEGGT